MSPSRGARAALLGLAALGAGPPAAARPDLELELLARLELGPEPHQIAFDERGERALVAIAGADRVVVVDVATRAVVRAAAIGPGPVGVAWLPTVVDDDGEPLERFVVSRFGGRGLAVLAGDDPAIVAELETGPAPTFLTPLARERFLVPVEGADRLWLVDASAAGTPRSFPTGRRPFPTGATRDGRLAFCPQHEDGTLGVVDLYNERVLESVAVGARPCGATVLPRDVHCAVALRGEDRVVLVNTASRAIVGEWRDGLGDGPVATVVTPDERLAFVACIDDATVAVVDLGAAGTGPVPDPAPGRVLGRFATGELPAVLAVSPSGDELWVACQGTDDVRVYRIPEAWRARPPAPPPDGARTEVGVLGLIHGDHRTSERFGLDRVRAAVLAYAPDALLVEIPPAHFDAAWAQVVAGEPVTEERTKVFPEYTDCLLHLALEHGIDVVPSAGWSLELSVQRARRVAEYRQDPERLAAYEAAQAAALAPWEGVEMDASDPHVIHSARYDARIETELGPYDALMSDWIGPGGWRRVNAAHLALVHRAIDARPGQRLLVTFGAGHKHRFRADLARRAEERGDVELVDLRPYLGPAEETMEAVCEREIVELHQFFEDWFCARLGDDDRAFARFEAVMAADFEIVNPEGRTTPRDVLVPGLRAGHGRWRDADGALTGRVRVANVRVRAVGAGLFVAAYEEWQQEGAEAERGRRSTAVLRRTERPTPLGLEWLVVHETWLDGEGR